MPPKPDDLVDPILPQECPPEWEEECDLTTQYYDIKYTCRCMYKAQCKMMCPQGQALMPTEECRCADLSEIAALYPDNKRVPDYIQRWKEQAVKDRQCPNKSKTICEEGQYFDDLACQCFYEDLCEPECGEG